MRFDEAVPTAIKTIQEAIGKDTSEVVVIRDPVGIVSVVVKTSATGSRLHELANTLDRELGRYSPGSHSILLRREDLVDPDSILDPTDQIANDGNVTVIDRLVTNQDWLRRPIIPTSPVPLATFFSIKGGVGRTTALAVLAWHLAREGHDVIAVDLDLESPGLGAALIESLPDWGLVDWLTEDLVGQSDSVSFDDLIAQSPIAEGLAGSLAVLPAFGSKTAGYIGKLGRTSATTFSRDDKAETIADRLARLIQRLSNDRCPRTILLDARAGMHDLAAAAVTQVAAEVFLFSRDDKSDWAALKHLFMHLRNSRSIEFGAPEHDLRWRLKMVGAQIGTTERDRASVRDHSYEVWSNLYDLSESGSDATAFSYDLLDEEAPHNPIIVPFHLPFRGMNLTNSSSRPVWETVWDVYREFLVQATTRLVDAT